MSTNVRHEQWSHEKADLASEWQEWTSYLRFWRTFIAYSIPGNRNLCHPTQSTCKACKLWMEQHDEHPLSDNEDPSHDATESDTVTAGNVIRPPSQFTIEKATEHAPDHLKKSMDMAKTDTYFQISDNKSQYDRIIWNDDGQFAPWCLALKSRMPASSEDFIQLDQYVNTN